MSADRVWCLPRSRSGKTYRTGGSVRENRRHDHRRCRVRRAGCDVGHAGTAQGQCDCRLTTGVTAVRRRAFAIEERARRSVREASRARAHRRSDLGCTATAISAGRPSCGSKIAWVCRRVSWRIELACDDADQPEHGLAFPSGIDPGPEGAIRLSPRRQPNPPTRGLPHSCTPYRHDWPPPREMAPRHSGQHEISGHERRT